MPNQIILASGAVVAVSVAVATAMAIYESPELRRYADDMRRRIALALHSMGEGINPTNGEPLYNRPEDADGFLQSRAGPEAEAGVDADEASKRRQREELLYWNSQRMAKEEDEMMEKAVAASLASNTQRTRGSSFDDFLRPDDSGEQGAFVFNTGADAGKLQDGLRHRGEGGRGFVTALHANPFADEYHIGNDEVEDERNSNNIRAREEVFSDIYSATTRDRDEPQTTILEHPSNTLIDFGDDTAPSDAPSSTTMERELPEDEYMVAGQDDRNDAYSSIQAWAQDSSRNFYSPLPETPAAPISEPEMVSDGQLTPTDSVSVIGSGEDIGEQAISPSGRPYDVMSESEGMLTPASWSEVGSVVSENEPPLRA